jgi:hypothetical protein
MGFLSAGAGYAAKDSSGFWAHALEELDGPQIVQLLAGDAVLSLRSANTLLTAYVGFGHYVTGKSRATRATLKGGIWVNSLTLC